MRQDVCSEQLFSQIYHQWGMPLFRFMSYKTQDTDQANDFVQEAFITLWENCAKVSEDKAKSYLYTVAHRKFLNKVAHDKVVQNHQKQVDWHFEQQSPEFLLEEKEFDQKLKEALNALPQGQRTAFLMNRIDQMTYTEIAQALDLSVKAVEKRMHLALKTLRQNIIELENR